MTAELIVQPSNLGLYSYLNWSVCIALERLPTAYQLESPDPCFLSSISAVILTDIRKGFSSFPSVPKVIFVAPGNVSLLNVITVTQMFGGSSLSFSGFPK